MHKLLVPLFEKVQGVTVAGEPQILHEHNNAPAPGSPRMRAHLEHLAGQGQPHPGAPQVGLHGAVFEVEGGGANDVQQQADDDDDEEAWRQAEAQRTNKAMAFLARPFLVDACFVFLKSLQPEIRLMGALLHACSAGSAVHKLAHSIQAPLVLALHDREESMSRTFFESCHSMVTDTTHWLHISPDQQLVTSMLKVVLKSCAVVYQLCACAFHRYPLRLLLLPEFPDQLVPELLGLPACMRVEFVGEFLAAFPDEQALRSQTAVAILRAVLDSVDGNNFSTERLHSENRRMSASRTQTHSMDVAHVGVRHQVHSGWPWAVSLRKWRHLAEVREKKKEARVRQQRVGHGDRRSRGQPSNDNQQGPRKKRRPGTGGAWRTFVHSRHERFDRMSMTDLAAEYRALDEETKEHFNILGAAATSARRAGMPGFMERTKRRRAVVHKDPWWAWGELTQLPGNVPPLPPSQVSCELDTPPSKDLLDCRAHSSMSRLVALNAQPLLQPQTPYDERALQRFAAYLRQGVQCFAPPTASRAQEDADAEQLWQASPDLKQEHDNLQVHMQGAQTVAARTWCTTYRHMPEHRRHSPWATLAREECQLGTASCGHQEWRS